jgi:hypothetical protein
VINDAIRPAPSGVMVELILKELKAEVIGEAIEKMFFLYVPSA